MRNAKILATAITTTMIAAAPVFVAPAIAQQTAAPTNVSDAELDAFVVAYKDVRAIEQEYAARVEETSDEAERQAIIDEAQAEMIQAVEASPDIAVERYIEILQLSQNDPDLQAELTAKLQD